MPQQNILFPASLGLESTPFDFLSVADTLCG